MFFDYICIFILELKNHKPVVEPTYHRQSLKRENLAAFVVVDQDQCRRVLSSDDEDMEKSVEAKPTATNFWSDVFSEKEDKWVAVDLLKSKVNAVDSISVSISLFMGSGVSGINGNIYYYIFSAACCF